MKKPIQKYLLVNKHLTVRDDQVRELDRIQALAGKEFTVLTREGIDLVIKKYQKKYPPGIPQ